MDYEQTLFSADPPNDFENQSWRHDLWNQPENNQGQYQQVNAAWTGNMSSSVGSGQNQAVLKLKPHQEFPLGQPGGLDDPNRRSMNGSTTKWYFRYLRDGLDPMEAQRKAFEHQRKHVPGQDAASNWPNSLQQPSVFTPNWMARTSIGCGGNASTTTAGTKIQLNRFFQKWYRTYLRRGFSPDDARLKALEHRQFPAKKKTLKKSKKSSPKSKKTLVKSSPKKLNSTQTAPPAKKAVISTKKQKTKHVPPLGGSNNSMTRSSWKLYSKYLSEGLDPVEAKCKALKHQQTPNKPKMVVKESIPISSKISVSPTVDGDASTTTAPRNVDDGQSRSNSAESNESCTAVSILPVGYPKELLSSEELAELEEAILMEIVNGTDVPLRLTGIRFERGFMVVNCHCKEAADWLMNVASRLTAWKGIPVEPRMGDNVPLSHRITLYLPNSAGKSDDFLLGLLRNQNKLSTKAWKLLSRRDEGTNCVLVISIDEGTMQTITANDNTLWFRYGTIPVCVEGDNSQDIPMEKHMLSKSDSGEDSVVFVDVEQAISVISLCSESSVECLGGDYISIKEEYKQDQSENEVQEEPNSNRDCAAPKRVRFADMLDSKEEHSQYKTKKTSAILTDPSFYRELNDVLNLDVNFLDGSSEYNSAREDVGQPASPHSA